MRDIVFDLHDHGSQPNGALIVRGFLSPHNSLDEFNSLVNCSPMHAKIILFCLQWIMCIYESIMRNYAEVLRDDGWIMPSFN